MLQHSFFASGLRSFSRRVAIEGGRIAFLHLVPAVIKQQIAGDVTHTRTTYLAKVRNPFGGGSEGDHGGHGGHGGHGDHDDDHHHDDHDHANNAEAAHS